MAKSNMDQDILKVLFSEQETMTAFRRWAISSTMSSTTGTRCLWAF